MSNHLKNYQKLDLQNCRSSTVITSCGSSRAGHDFDVTFAYINFRLKGFPVNIMLLQVCPSHQYFTFQYYSHSPSVK